MLYTNILQYDANYQGIILIWEINPVGATALHHSYLGQMDQLQ